MNNPKLVAYKSRLDQYCIDKGRSKKSSPFENALNDLKKYVDFDAMRSV